MFADVLMSDYLVCNRIQQNKGWCSLDIVKCYFEVTNAYVIKKLMIIMFPPSLMVSQDFS